MLPQRSQTHRLDRFSEISSYAVIGCMRVVPGQLGEIPVIAAAAAACKTQLKFHN